MSIPAKPVAPEELSHYFRLADMFVMPNDSEEFGILFIEADPSGIVAIGGNEDRSMDRPCEGELGRV
jgi:hypothetical protein